MLTSAPRGDQEHYGAGAQTLSDIKGTPNEEIFQYAVPPPPSSQSALGPESSSLYLHINTHQSTHTPTPPSTHAPTYKCVLLVRGPQSSGFGQSTDLVFLPLLLPAQGGTEPPTWLSGVQSPKSSPRSAVPELHAWHRPVSHQNKRGTIIKSAQSLPWAVGPGVLHSGK